MQKYVLKLVVKKKWFDMIVSGEKTEEYREIKPYWIDSITIGKPQKGMCPDEWLDTDVFIIRFK